MGALLLVALIVLSFFGSVFVIGNAFYQRQQFYPAVIYLTKSNFCVSVLSSQAFILVISFGILCKKIFFGTLRQIEIEQLVERFWYVFSETFVAFAVFRDELDAKFVIYFTTLVFFKAFHWLAEERIDFMERSPVINLMFHARILSLFVVLTYMDLYLFGLSFAPLMDSQKKNSQLTIYIIFAFEYVLLFHSLVTMAFKYMLHSIDLWLENPWERKVTVLLYFDLLMSGAKVVLYTFYVYLMIDTQTVPLFVIRPFYQTLRNFKKALLDVMMSRNAIRIMNTLYPNATLEELQQGDNVCIICREEMLNENTCKKLPCNHIFHISCLTTWFQRQQTCPTCRLDILTNANNLSQQLLPDQQQPQQQQQGQQQQQPNVEFAIPRLRINFAFRFEFLRNMELLNAARAMLGQNERQPENQIRAAPERHAQNAETGQQQQPQAQTQQQSEQSQQQQPQVPNYLNMHPLQFPNIAFVPQPLPQFPLEPILPPEELRTLTDEQLNALEGRARKNIEARIECLRNVQVLINSAIIMMQQYNNAAFSSNEGENAPGPSAQSATSSQS